MKYFVAAALAFAALVSANPVVVVTSSEAFPSASLSEAAEPSASFSAAEEPSASGSVAFPTSFPATTVSASASATPTGGFVVTGIFTTCLTLTFEAPATATSTPVVVTSAVEGSGAVAKRAVTSVTSVDIAQPTTVTSIIGIGHPTTVTSIIGTGHPTTVISTITASGTVHPTTVTSSQMQATASSSPVVVSSTVGSPIAVFTTCLAFLPAQAVVTASTFPVSEPSASSSFVIAEPTASRSA
ncbi:hypothetical protein FB45DRAFT_61070 [Roridomyces roridus]|uniref:Uncharacterized protein n=1 Tax=Roridomyces roridus TaxID=1738132 RepID=A0AAD7FM95_9AGAR|nr:hypothetical protein FB45DRAFT_61070 [Roridomyces roridus]